MTKETENKLEHAVCLLEQAIQFFGSCWCKKKIGYMCPQCLWRVEYDNFCKSIRFTIKGEMK